MALFRSKTNTLGTLGDRTFGLNQYNTRKTVSGGVPFVFKNNSPRMKSVPQFDIRPDRKVFLGTARMPMTTRTDEQGLPIAVGSERKKAIRRLLL